MKFDQDGWLDIAKEYNINGNSWDRGAVHATHLVIHGTAGGSDGDGTMAYMGNNGVSTHFAISTNGDIWQGVSCDRAAWGNAPLNAPTLNFAHADLNPNLWTISVEFCKPDATNQITITDAQRASGFPLIKYICETYNIAKHAGDGNSGIIRHADINSTDRAHCPGTFPFDDLYTYVQKGNNTMSIPNGWVDNGHTLTAPNGIPVVLGFRDHILAQNWRPDNWPLAPETGTTPLEVFDPTLGGGTQQFFYWTLLGWTQAKGVFEERVGAELLATRKLLAALTAAPPDMKALLQSLLTTSTQLQKEIQDALDTILSTH